jgi:hypothetical protein
VELFDVVGYFLVVEFRGDDDYRMRHQLCYTDSLSVEIRLMAINETGY